MAILRFVVPEQTFEFDIEDEELDNFRRVNGGDFDGVYACFPDAIANYELDIHSRLDMEVEFLDD